MYEVLKWLLACGVARERPSNLITRVYLVGAAGWVTAAALVSICVFVCASAQAQAAAACNMRVATAKCQPHANDAVI